MKRSFFILIIVAGFMLFWTGCDKSKNLEKPIHEVFADTVKHKPLSHFLFIGKWYGKSGVYSYDFNSKKYETVWWHPRENVTMLISKPEDEPAFFFTIRRMGVRGNFPFFERVKIYRISSDLSNTGSIYKIEKGMQITSRWNDDGNLEVVFTSIDITDPSYINKYKKTFDKYGKLIDDEIETFNLVWDGFPELMPKRNPTVSPSGNYGISVIDSSVFLKTADSDSLVFITTVKHNLNKISWDDSENFLFFSTLATKNRTIKTRNPETSGLYIYSIYKDSMVASWGGNGAKNFFLSDSIVVFDNGFSKRSSINIYNYVKGELVDEIKMKDECGLFFLPKM